MKGKTQHRGRAAGFNPPNRFESIAVGKVEDELAEYFVDPEPDRNILTTFYIPMSS